MHNKFALQSLYALAASFTLAIPHSQAMDTTDDYLVVNSHIATHMEQALVQTTSGDNALVCPIGPKQILADLSQISEPRARREIAAFTGTDFNFDSYKSFIATLPKNTDFPKEAEEKKSKRRYYDYTPKAPKNAFFNGHFILTSDTLDLNEERAHQLSQLKATVTPSDFSDPKKSADYVNSIVDTHTNHLIPTILTEDAFSGDPVGVVLLSTLYINNSWNASFDDRYFQFKGPKGKKRIKGFGEEVAIPYSQTKSGITVSLPASGDTSLIVHMNHDGTVAPITHSHINEFLNNHVSHETIDFKMPAFTIENTIDLKSLLSKAMPSLMGGQSFTVDLFSKPESVYIDTFVQKNKLDVTKDGLEGASATALTMCLESACFSMVEYKKITIDRPFSFAVIKMIEPNKWLTLFSGQIFDPIAPAEKD